MTTNPDRYRGEGIWARPRRKVTTTRSTSVRWELSNPRGLTIGMMRDFLDACQGIDDGEHLRAIEELPGEEGPRRIHLEVFVSSSDSEEPL